jgi:hypothetical protein
MLTMPHRKTTTARLVGGLSALAVITALAWYARAHGHSDFAAGVISGGVFAIALALASGFTGRRGPALMRLVGGVADERERTLWQRASAHGMIAMFVPACIFAVFLPDASALVATGIILWAGLLTITASFTVQARRA